MHATPQTAAVKPAAYVILFDSTKPRTPRPFATGLTIKPATVWATDAEYREHFLANTISAAEYHARFDSMASDAYQLDRITEGRTF